jgi:hypothetical protein
MSLTTSLIAIKGNHIEKSTAIFGYFKLIDAKKDTVFSSWQQVVEVLEDELDNPSDHFQRRVIWFDNGWTIIEDLSLLLSSDNVAIENISRDFNSPVFSLITQGTSGSYGFSYFDNDTKRMFLLVDGEIMENEGRPLDVESAFNINKRAFFDDIHGVAKAFGINWPTKESLNKFTVKYLENSPELNREIDDFLKNQPAQGRVKPWWKFW